MRYAYHCNCGHVGEEASTCGLEGREVLCSQCGRLATLMPQAPGWAAPMGRGMSVTTDDLEREADSQVARERAHMDKATATEGDRRAELRSELDRAQVQLLKKILGRHHGGIYKRIDENRELLELLQREAPELLAKQPWVVGWLESQDGFLCDLESAVPLTDVQFQKHPRFPRPWPTGVR